MLGRSVSAEQSTHLALSIRHSPESVTAPVAVTNARKGVIALEENECVVAALLGQDRCAPSGTAHSVGSATSTMTDAPLRRRTSVVIRVASRDEPAPHRV